MSSLMTELQLPPSPHIITTLVFGGWLGIEVLPLVISRESLNLHRSVISEAIVPAQAKLARPKVIVWSF
jgi:hypothetical protein